jgi:hypothetical protein
MKPGKSFEMKLPSGESKCSDRKLGLYIFFIALLEKCTWLWAGVGLIEIWVALGWVGLDWVMGWWGRKEYFVGRFGVGLGSFENLGI